MKEPKSNTDFTIIKESDPPKNTEETLLENESILVSYKTSRGYVLFTDKRIQIAATEKKKLVLTIPYKSIIMYSTQTAKGLRDQGLLQVWTNPTLYKFNIKKSVDIKFLESIIAHQILE